MNWLIEEVIGAQPVMFDVWRGDNLTLVGVDYGVVCNYVADNSDGTDVFHEHAPGFEPITLPRTDYLEALSVFEGEGMGEE